MRSNDLIKIKNKSWGIKPECYGPYRQAGANSKDAIGTCLYN